MGVVEARLDGNRTYYRANPQHPLYPDIRNLVLKTDGLVEVLRQAIDAPDIELAFVFGSIAAGTAKAESDIDLMVIGTISLRRLSKLLSGIATRIGREIDPHVFSVEEIEQRKKLRDHFVSTVLAAPKLLVEEARMSLQDWANNGWLRAHQTSQQEIADLFLIVARDLKDATGSIQRTGVLASRTTPR